MAGDEEHKIARETKDQKKRGQDLQDRAGSTTSNGICRCPRGSDTRHAGNTTKPNFSSSQKNQLGSSLTGSVGKHVEDLVLDLLQRPLVVRDVNHLRAPGIHGDT